MTQKDRVEELGLSIEQILLLRTWIIQARKEKNKTNLANYRLLLETALADFTKLLLTDAK